MSLEAAGAYLWELRQARHLSRDQLAQRLNTSRSQIERIDYGQGEARASVIFLYARAVGADLDELSDLMLDPAATVEQARVLARARPG